jgi:RNA polymerase sigma-70 factor, ECF subfamily
MAGSTGRRDPGGADPADLCQEAMVRIVQGLPTFDGQSRLTTWMTRIAMNVCLSHLRATKLRQHGSLDATRPGEGREGSSGFDRYSDLGDRKGEPAPGSGVQTEDERRAFAAAWSRLDPDQRAILVLRDVRDLDYEQIASVLGLTVGTVKSRIFRARQALREQIDSGRRGRHGDLQGAESEPFQ